MHAYLVPVYATYLVAVIGLCAWLAITLFRNGAVFLEDVFEDRPAMAQAVNRLLVTGFAMVNLGYGFFLVNGGTATDGAEAFQILARKLGILLVSLAAVHFVNLYVFHHIAAEARTLLRQVPWLGTELVVVANDGATWVGPAAFLTCLWATRRYRSWSYRLSGPTFAPLAERFFHLVSDNRRFLARAAHLDRCDDGTCHHRHRANLPAPIPPSPRHW